LDEDRLIKEAKELFNTYDANHNGVIDRKELQFFMIELSKVFDIEPPTA